MIDIFYNQIVKEALTGRIDCFAIYNIIFNVEIEGVTYIASNNNENLIIPTLYINNKEEFDKKLTEYVILAKEFYNSDNYYEEIKDNDAMIEKTIMTLLWANATYEDFNNPINFIQKRIDFIKNNISIDDEIYNETLDCNIKYKTNICKVGNETPYKFNATIFKENNEYQLPAIYFGISNNELYIYAIQSTKTEPDKFQKNINRKLYKVDENFDVKNDTYENYDSGNLKDISSSFLLVSNIFIGLMKEYDINKIIISSILIERWNSKETYYKYKIDHTKEGKEELQENYDKEHQRIQKNLTEKLLRTFRRLEYHHTGINTLSYPYEFDSNMVFSLDKVDECNNELLNETFNIKSNTKGNR
ncbi:MAG TPA: hypothetical protein PLV83_05965 [Bacilli bacterium]|nr:hypothetical protein [Bacilli bacterium]